jgi:hypothetical protein
VHRVSRETKVFRVFRVAREVKVFKGLKAEPLVLRVPKDFKDLKVLKV